MGWNLKLPSKNTFDRVGVTSWLEGFDFKNSKDHGAAMSEEVDTNSKMIAIETVFRGLAIARLILLSPAGEVNLFINRCLEFSCLDFFKRANVYTMHE